MAPRVKHLFPQIVVHLACCESPARSRADVSFDDLLDHEDMRAIGGELGESRTDLLRAIRDIYPPEKEALGVLAIEIERI